MALTEKQRRIRRAKIMRWAEKARELDHIDDRDVEPDLLTDEPRPPPTRDKRYVVARRARRA